MFMSRRGRTASQAVDINMSGEMVFVGQWSRTSGNKGNVGAYTSDSSHHSFYQRFRAQVDITASEALNGVVMFEIGDTVWGKSRDAAGRHTGGALGADGVTIEVKRAYLDWIPPNTDLKVRIGIQGFANPTFVRGAGDHVQVINAAHEVAGITLNYDFTPNVGMTAWWFRPFSDNIDNSNRAANDRRFDDMDVFGLAVPLTFDGVKVTPWAMYASIGRDIADADVDIANGTISATGVFPGTGNWRQMFPAWFNNTLPGYLVPAADDGQGNGWWAGLTGEVTAWNPFRLSWDFNYGSVDMGDIGGVIDVKRSGWIATLMAEYKLDFMTPGLAFWYGTGDDDDWTDGSEMMPSISASSGLTSFGQDASWGNTPGGTFALGTAGTWGIMGQLKDITFVEDLKHTFRVAYYRGTNDKDMTLNNGGVMIAPWSGSGGSNFMYLTEKDSAWEFNLDTTYQIYKNLSVGLEMGYIKMNISESAWGRAVDNAEDDMYKVAVGLRYTF